MGNHCCNHRLQPTPRGAAPVLVVPALILTLMLVSGLHLFVALTRVRARNFKSFASLDARLGRLNVLIGANASGKSNFLSILQFLRVSPQAGFVGSVRSLGGAEYLPRLQSQGDPIVVGLEADNPLATLDSRSESLTQQGGTSKDRMLASYLIRFGFESGESLPKISYERLRVRFITRRKSGHSSSVRNRSVERASIEVVRRQTRLTVRSTGGSHTPPQVQGLLEYLKGFSRLRIPGSTSLMDDPRTFPFFIYAFPDLGQSSMYRLEPSKERDLPIPGGRPILNVDGSNLAFVAWNILQDPARKERLLELVQDYLPFIRDLEVQNVGQHLLLTAKEARGGRRALPSSLLSDGTLNVIALVIAMHFEPRPLIVLEEPEKSVHPRLLSRLLTGIHELSKSEQVILTTHNPEVLRYAPLDSLLLLSRGVDGRSEVTRPASSKRVRAFLKHDLGVPEIFTLGQLG